MKSFAMDLPKMSEPFDSNIKFGPIIPHDITGEGIAFVSTYNLSLPLVTMILVRLDDHRGHERYIVFQKPYFEINVEKEAEDYSPYTIRSHPLIHLHGAGGANVSITLSDAENISEDGKLFMVTINDGNKAVSTHFDKAGYLTFSPNNMHLGGLPERLLNESEIYSFVSHIDGIDGLDKKIDTLHILMGDSDLFFDMANGPEVCLFGDFIRLLETLCPVTMPSFVPHLAKIKRFLAP